MDHWSTSCSCLLCPLMTYGSLVNMVYLLMVSMDDIWVIGQHGNGLWCLWMKYGSLVNMVVAYGVHGIPMDDISVISQHGSCLWCPWMTYGSLVNMVYLLMVCSCLCWSTWCSCLWCPWMTYGSLVNMVVAYGVMVSPMDNI